MGSRWRRVSLAGLIGVMGGSGVLHFVTPAPYERIVPSWIPAGPAVFWSGVAELAVAAGLAHPRTRRHAAWATIALLIGIYPANIEHALMAEPGTTEWWGTRVRLPIQFALIWWASTFTRSVSSASAGRRARSPRRVGW